MSGMPFQSFFSDAECASYYGVITDIDEKYYMAKADLHPLGITTGWLPISTPAIGFFKMPSIGTLVKVDLICNNINNGVIVAMLYDKKQSPGKTLNEHQSEIIPEGWFIFKHYESGAEFHFTKAGHYKFYTPEGYEIKSEKDINMESTLNINIDSAASITLTGATKIKLDSTVVELSGSPSLKKLVNEDFIALFNQHTHLGNLGAPTTPPGASVPPSVAVVGLHTTTETTAG